MFALVVVALFLISLNRASYELFNASGYFCERQIGDAGPSVVEGEERPLTSENQDEIVTLSYRSFCADLRVNIRGYADRYKYIVERDEKARDLEPPPWFAWPFRRNLNAEWHQIIVKEGRFGDKEYVLDANYCPTLARPITDWGGLQPIDVYFYVNDIALGIPGLHDLFYRRSVGKVTIKIESATVEDAALCQCRRAPLGADMCEALGLTAGSRRPPNAAKNP